MSKPKLAKLKFIDNGNITDKHLGRRGLHLNHNGNVILRKIYYMRLEVDVRVMI